MLNSKENHQQQKLSFCIMVSSLNLAWCVHTILLMLIQYTACNYVPNMRKSNCISVCFCI